MEVTLDYVLGEWTELTSMLRVRLQSAPSNGKAVLEVQKLMTPGPYCKYSDDLHEPHDTDHGFDCPGLRWVAA